MWATLPFEKYSPRKAAGLLKNRVRKGWTATPQDRISTYKIATMSIPFVSKESKIFDPRDASTPSYGCELLDCSVARRGNDWWMVLAGQPNGHGATDLFSANLPRGSRLSATGWKPLRNAAGELVPLARRDRS